MSNLPEKQTQNGAMLKMVSSNAQYPYDHYLSFELPFDTYCRNSERNAVRRTLQQIGIEREDMILVEDMHGLSMFFQNAGDLINFRIADEFDVDGIIEQGFEIKDRKRKDKGPLRKVRNHFEKARKRAGVDKDHFAIQVNNSDGTIDVQTASVDEHLAIWRHLPRKTKQRLSLMI